MKAKLLPTTIVLLLSGSTCWSQPLMLVASQDGRQALLYHAENVNLSPHLDSEEFIIPLNSETRPEDLLAFQSAAASIPNIKVSISQQEILFEPTCHCSLSLSKISKHISNISITLTATLPEPRENDTKHTIKEHLIYRPTRSDILPMHEKITDPETYGKANSDLGLPSNSINIADIGYGVRQVLKSVSTEESSLSPSGGTNLELNIPDSVSKNGTLEQYITSRGPGNSPLSTNDTSCGTIREKRILSLTPHSSNELFFESPLPAFSALQENLDYSPDGLTDMAIYLLGNMLLDEVESLKDQFFEHLPTILISDIKAILSEEENTSLNVLPKLSLCNSQAQYLLKITSKEGPISHEDVSADMVMYIQKLPDKIGSKLTQLLLDRLEKNNIKLIEALEDIHNRKSTANTLEPDTDLAFGVWSAGTQKSENTPTQAQAKKNLEEFTWSKTRLDAEGILRVTPTTTQDMEFHNSIIDGFQNDRNWEGALKYINQLNQSSQSNGDDISAISEKFWAEFLATASPGDLLAVAKSINLDEAIKLAPETVKSEVLHILRKSKQDTFSNLRRTPAPPTVLLPPEIEETETHSVEPPTVWQEFESILSDSRELRKRVE
ncbi:hypothetical protein [Mangrovicoccus algicola]|uniref:Secreted protein n=1 Tax=Mangrovicoccus algicola TaxID=2771008 RepID=A0A8J6Z9W5_9RHOB|nr:hypothetical protein [Mangrovicoccus algicola]MBE3639035.1 hypothetical protein [Mangrovicoccus algicola]